MIGLVIFFVAAYVITIGLYARSGCGCPIEVTQGQAGADGTAVTINIDELQSTRGSLNATVSVSPGPELVDPLTHDLTDDLAVAVHSAVTPTKRIWTKGVVPGDFSVPLTIAGDPSSWPFDVYRSGPITVDVFHGTSPVPVRTAVNFVDRLPGWRVSASDAGGRALYRLSLHRSPSTGTFAAVIVGVMIALAGVAAFVAIQTARDRRKFQPPMTTWYAAMLFAVMPLRNVLPDSPPIGSWIDVTVTLWVLVVLVMSMLLYVYCWWRHLRPEPDKPA